MKMRTRSSGKLTEVRPLSPTRHRRSNHGATSSVPVAIAHNEIDEESEPWGDDYDILLRAVDFDAPGAKARNEEEKEKETEAVPRVTFGGTTTLVFDSRDSLLGFATRDDVDDDDLEDKGCEEVEEREANEDYFGTSGGDENGDLLIDALLEMDEEDIRKAVLAMNEEESRRLLVNIYIR